VIKEENNKNRINNFLSQHNKSSVNDKKFIICVVLVVFDVTMVMRIQERKAQIARTAYFTVPIVSATVGWMGALEIAKKVMVAPSPFFHLNLIFVMHSVADPGCLSRILILIFTHPGSRILDPKTATKERGEKNLLSYLFL
jgi:hypothetical protein